MDKTTCGMSGIVAAAGIGLALSSGYGISSAEPTSDPASSVDSVASADREPGRDNRDSESESPTDSAGTDDDEGDAATDETAGADDPRDSAEPSEAVSPADDSDSAPTEGSVPDDVETVPDDDESAEDEELAEQDTSPPSDRNNNHHGPDSPDTTRATPQKDPITEEEPAPIDSNPVDAPSPDPAPAVEAALPEPADLGTTALTSAATAPAPVFESASPAATPPSVAATVLSAFGIGGGAPPPVDSQSLWVALGLARRPSASPAAEAASTTGTATSAPALVAGSTVNVKDHGAVGDGITDDSAAIKAAEAALTSGDTLYFPEGDYRFAQRNPAGEAAIELSGLSNVTVEFAEGARLIMDNLDVNGHGTSHGIRIEGAASHVTILNATIEWTTAPSTRSFGDGISVLGWASDSPPPLAWTGSTGTVEFVSIIDSRVVNAPQAGAVIMGASDVTVTNFTAIGTKADGLHFNANRRVTVDGLIATNTGDDGLAFVTYYDATQPWTYGPTDGPFNQSGVGEWNNGGSVASHITVTGGRANGVRVQGGYDITITDVTVTDKWYGIQVNSAISTGPGDWTSLASRDVHISDVTIEDVQTGIVLATNNIDGTEGSQWWDFSGVTISDVTIRGATNWSVAVETPATTTSKYAGITLQNIYAESLAVDGPFGGGNGGILLASLRDSTVDNVRLVSDHNSDILILGAGQLRGDLGVADLPSSNLTLNDVILEGPGRILIQDIAGLQVGNMASYGADGTAVMLYRVKDASFDNITAYMPGRGLGEGYGVRLLQVADIDIANIEVTMDDHVGSSWWAVELGGGNPDDIAGDGVRIENVTYVSDRDDTESHIGVQGGPYGPASWYIHATWRHNGETVPQWRSASYGDISPL